MSVLCFYRWSIMMARLRWRETPQICYKLSKKYASKAWWVYHVPILQKNNNGVQYRKPTREYTNYFMLHRHMRFTYLCWDYSKRTIEYTRCIKSPGEKTIAILYTNRNNIDMIRLEGLRTCTHTEQKHGMYFAS